jgi:hypothetical protein
VKLALMLAFAGLALNAWMLWRPLPLGVHPKPRCTLKPKVIRPEGGSHGTAVH